MVWTMSRHTRELKSDKPEIRGFSTLWALDKKTISLEDLMLRARLKHAVSIIEPKKIQSDRMVHQNH